MLMDLFYGTVAEDQKQRVHFHSFMLDIHASEFIVLRTLFAFIYDQCII